jgi:hypothetical protein
MCSIPHFLPTAYSALPPAWRRVARSASPYMTCEHREALSQWVQTTSPDEGLVEVVTWIFASLILVFVPPRVDAPRRCFCIIGVARHAMFLMGPSRAPPPLHSIAGFWAVRS